jgi:hypothetical protein
MIHDISDTTRHLIAVALSNAIRETNAIAARCDAMDDDTSDRYEYLRAVEEMTVLQDDIAAQDDCITITI